MMTAILMVPMLGAAGLAVDYSAASDARQQLQNAADAAAIGAISEKSVAVQTAINMSGDGPISSVQLGTVKLFDQNLDARTQGFVTDVASNVVKSGTQVTSKLTYTASVPTNFMRIFGVQSMAVSGESSAVIQTATFMDFYLLLDNTPSMGVGATPSDVATMVANTSDKCAFACHDLSQNGNDYYALAKKKGVTMRIDVVREATENLMTTATDPEIRHYDNQFRMAVYTFGKTAETAGLYEVASLSDKLNQVQTQSSDIDLMSIPKQNYNNDQQTSLDSALTKLNGIIGTPGSGMDSTKPQKWVFLVSDGVGDSAKSVSACTEKTTGGRCQEPIDTKYCDTLKKRGVKIAVLYTTYLPLPTNAWYNTWIKPFQDTIGPRMQACATPGYYFEVSPTEGISDAMNKLFKKIVLAPRITS